MGCFRILMFCIVSCLTHDPLEEILFVLTVCHSLGLSLDVFSFEFALAFDDHDLNLSGCMLDFTNLAFQFCGESVSVLPKTL